MVEVEHIKIQLKNCNHANLVLRNLDVYQEKNSIIKFVNSIFCDEQHFEDINLDIQNKEIHRIGLFENNKIIGYCQLKKESYYTFKLEKVCINQMYRRNGYGNALVQYAEDQALQCSAKKIIIYSQLHATKFYIGMGYQTEDIPFMYLGQKHIKMFKYLKKESEDL